MKYLGPTQSGSLAGDTASRNRFGQYFRRRAVPVNPSSTFQLNQRARMALNAAAWRALTAIQRAGWATLGLSMIRTDSLGQSYDLNGFLAYCSVNNNKLDAGDAVVSDAPAIVTPPSLLTATITLTAAAMSIAYTATPLADYRLIAVTAAAAASPHNIFAAYQARLGTPVVGTRIGFSLAIYNGGFKGVPFAVSQLVV